MKKPGKDRRLRRRFIAVFLAAVMLPSLIMAYLGLRYIKQEEQWQEQLVVSNLKVTLSNAVHKIEEDVHQAVLQVFDSLTYETSLPTSIVPQQLHKFLTEHTFFKELFVMDNKGRLLFPRSFRLQKASGQIVMSSTLNKQRLIRGEESEARGKYNDAIDEYQTGLGDCTYTQEKLAFRIRIARCRYKTGDLAGAQHNYQLVLDEDANQFLGEELPYQFIASFQLAQIFDQLGQHSKAFHIIAQLYSNMLAEFQRFEQKQFNYYLSKIRNELQKHLQYAGTVAPALLDSLIQVEEVFLQEPKHYSFLQVSVIPSIETALRAKLGHNSVRYILIEHSDNLIQVAFREFGNTIQGIRTIGIILKRSYLSDLVIKLLHRIDVGENLRIILLDDEKTIMKPGETKIIPIVEEPLHLLEGTMDGYRLALMGTRETSIEEFTSRAVIPYYALILVITVVIALGVIFIFHDISREQELARMKSDFISNVTHEIKTPITTIRSLAENVKEGWVTSIDKQQDYFRLIARESERLGHLVENTLDFSRIESGSKRYRMEDSSTQEVIEKTVDRFRNLTEGQQVEISCNISKNLAPIRMDVEALGQALLNLFDNAVKYSKERKIIMLIAEVEGDHLKIAVSDQGIGIDRKDIPRIFEKFYRSESNTKKNITGSGIGLTIVKEIVEAHNGRIEVVSERNKGSTFTIYIPIKREEAHV